MNRYFVHRYDVVRVKVAVEAENAKQAMLAADRYLANSHPIPSVATVGDHHELDDDAKIADIVGYPTWLHYEEPGQEVTGYLVELTEDDDPDNGQYFTGSHHPVLQAGQEYPEWPVDDWKYLVANGDTRLGYQDWACGQYWLKLNTSTLGED